MKKIDKILGYMFEVDFGLDTPGVVFRPIDEDCHAGHFEFKEGSLSWYESRQDHVSFTCTNS